MSDIKIPYKCLKDFYMSGGHTIAYRKNKTYYFTPKQWSAVSEISIEHLMNEVESFNEYFVLESNGLDLSEFLDKNPNAKLEYENAIRKAITHGVESLEAKEYWRDKY